MTKRSSRSPRIMMNSQELSRGGGKPVLLNSIQCVLLHRSRQFMHLYLHTMKRIVLISALLLTVSLVASGQNAGFRLNLPKRGKLTPIQKLNREGVKEVEKRHLEKAKKLFYDRFCRFDLIRIRPC